MKKRRSKRLRKTMVSLLAALALVTLPAAAALIPGSAVNDFGGESVTVYINGRCIYEGAPLIVNDTTYVSADSFQRAVGDTVTQIAAQDHALTAAGRAIYLPHGTITYHNETYYPIRALAQLYGAQVIWDGITSSVYISDTRSRAISSDDVYDNTDLYWLSRIIYAESGGEPLIGQLAVGSVVMNRRASAQYPNTIYGVIFDRKYGVQFTPTANGMIYKTPSAQSVMAAKMTLEGYLVSSDILYFIQEEIATNFWVVDHCTFVMRIGCHDFYA